LIVIAAAAMAEIADDIVPDLGDAAPIEHGYVAEDETVGAATAAENVVAAVTLNDVVAARTNNVLHILDLRHHRVISGRALRPQERRLDDVGLLRARWIRHQVAGLVEMDLDAGVCAG